jgi:hypothetical protein
MSTVMMSNFNAGIFVSAQMEKQLVNMHMDFGMRIVSECARLYGFDADEAVRALNIGSLKMDKKPVAKKSPSTKKVKQAKASFPIPFNGKAMEGCCGGLRYNRGLYTQCQGKVVSESGFCNVCQGQADKNGNGKPDCGTIGDRLAAGLYDFQDPKGKSPIAFTALLKKLKLSEEAVKEEAGKLNIEIDEEHFEFIALEKKKGRKSSKTDVPKKEKKEKGRPKKSKKVLELEGDSSDLFASLVAQANAVSESEPSSEPEDNEDEIIIEKNNDKESKRQAAEEEKAKKELAKLEKEAKRKAAEEEKAKKEAEKEAKRLAAEEEKAKREAEKEAKRKAAEEEKAKKEAEKEAKRLALEEEKAKKEAKRLAAEEEKKAKESKKSEKKESPKKQEAKENDEPDVVKRIEYEGKKYLKSKKTGIVYNLEQDVIGKWNDETQKIDFYENNSDEEEEEEGYESE